MPTAALARCPRCGCLQRTRGLCRVCRPTHRHTHPDAKKIYNSRAWKLLRDQVLSEEPVCRACRAPSPVEVDHIVAIIRAPHLALDRANLQALCGSCHSIKTRRESR